MSDYSTMSKYNTASLTNRVRSVTKITSGFQAYPTTPGHP